MLNGVGAAAAPAVPEEGGQQGAAVTREIPSLFHIVGRYIMDYEATKVRNLYAGHPAYTDAREQLSTHSSDFTQMARVHSVADALMTAPLADQVTLTTGRETDADIHAMLHGLPLLHYLIIEKTDGFTEAGIKEILATGRLRALSLVGDTVVTDEALTSLPERYEGKLETLHLDHCKALTAAGGEAIRKHFPQLKRVTLVDPSPAFETEVRKIRDVVVFVERNDFPL